MFKDVRRVIFRIYPISPIDSYSEEELKLDCFKHASFNLVLDEYNTLQLRFFHDIEYSVPANLIEFVNKPDYYVFTKENPTHLIFRYQLEEIMND